MLLRNYDNFQTVLKMCGVYGSSIKFITSAIFGDGVLSFKDTSGTISTSDFLSNTSDYRKPMFGYFYQSNGEGSVNTIGDSCLVCGYDDNEVSYDDYKINDKKAKLTYVGHSVTTATINENNEMVSTYTKTLYNSSNEDITINCIGVEYCATISNKSYNRWLIYKEKIEEITIPAGANVVLTFTTKAPMQQNKPANYEVTATTE